MSNLNQENKLTMFYILIAFTFSVTIRLIWIYQFFGYEPFIFNNEFMINTNDGYFWAEGARDLISGVDVNSVAQNFYDKFHQFNDGSPVNTAASQMTAFFSLVLPFSFESIILYMPVFLSSLVVIPIILIAKKFKNLEMGLISALLASITWSYYNRTMIGYYDTDMLNIVLPMFLLWSIIWAINTKKDIYLIITALDILVYRWWYPQSYSLELSFFALILFYTLIWDRKNLYNYKLLAIMMFAMMNFDGFIRFPIVYGIYYIFKQKKYDKYIYYILSLSILLFLLSGGFNQVWAQLKGYVFKDTILHSNSGLGLHFYSVMQTIREAGHIPFERFAQRISGHTITFALSFFGYLFLLYRHKIMLFSLPLVGLGFLASVGGLRFTIYAVPILAMGIAFLIVEVTNYITNKKSLRFLSYAIFTILILAPNIQHIINYKVPTVMNKDEVKVLHNLNKIASREDYVVSWWDYGYPIRYYSDVKTLIDGGKHSGVVNFTTSAMLTSPQNISAKLARLDVEYTEKNYKLKKDKNLTIASNIEQMTKDYGFDDTNDFLLSLDIDMKMPKKTRDIYFYLPFKMLGIYLTVEKFSNLDLMNGKENKSSFFYITNRFKDEGKYIDLDHGIRIDKQESVLLINNKKVPIKNFVKTYYSKDLKLQKKFQVLDATANINVIIMQNYNTYLVLDDKTYNSMFVQLMILEEYNKNLFELVESNLYAKVYKLKI
jgi:dolichyl-diphosphooligosaccharide--protein glycosyltransferase/undecaprenyl-diphosphooligosaccharide--protein glycosyltransferase